MRLKPVARAASRANGLLEAQMLAKKYKAAGGGYKS